MMETTCMLCGKVRDIAEMARTSEGDWYCRECRRLMLQAQLIGLQKARREQKEKGLGGKS